MTRRAARFVGSDSPEWQVSRVDGAEEGGPEWTVTFDVAALPGAVVVLSVREGDIVGLELRSDAGLTAQDLRLVPFGALAAAARSRLGATLAAWQTLGVPADEELRRHVDPPALRPGSPGHPDTVYAGLAVDYERWLATGAPISTLAASQNLSVQGLRSRIVTARKRGFLTAAPPGRPGGRATDKARRILEEENDGID